MTIKVKKIDLLEKPEKPVGDVVNELQAKRILALMEEGLSNGVGTPDPGNMCVEAAVAYAYGETHGDNPKCIHPNLRIFKIDLNDNLPFKDDFERGNMLKRIAIAQLGTKSKKYKKYKKYKIFLELAEKNILTQVLPKWLRRNTESALHYVVVANWLENGGSLEDASDAFGSDISYWKLDDDGPANFIIQFLGILNLDGEDEYNFQYDCVEACVQALVKMKTPGSKFLYLTEGKKKPAPKKKAVAAKKKKKR